MTDCDPFSRLVQRSNRAWCILLLPVLCSSHIEDATPPFSATGGLWAGARHKLYQIQINCFLTGTMQGLTTRLWVSSESWSGLAFTTRLSLIKRLGQSCHLAFKLNSPSAQLLVAQSSTWPRWQTQVLTIKFQKHLQFMTALPAISQGLCDLPKQQHCLRCTSGCHIKISLTAVKPSFFSCCIQAVATDTKQSGRKLTLRSNKQFYFPNCSAIIRLYSGLLWIDVYPNIRPWSLRIMNPPCNGFIGLQPKQILSILPLIFKKLCSKREIWGQVHSWCKSA